MFSKEVGLGSSIHVHLLNVRAAAITAECARDSIRAAEERLTRISSAGMDGVRVANGSVDYDRIAMRVHGLQAVKEHRGRDLAESVKVLKRFRAELDASGLGDDEQAVLWLKYVRGLSSEEIARVLDMPTHHIWPMLSTARAALARSLADGEAGYGHSPRY